MENKLIKERIINTMHIINPYMEIKSSTGDSYQDEYLLNILYEKDGLKKYLIYDCDLLREVCNSADGLFEYQENNSNEGDYTIVFSFKIGGKIRSFLGRTNTYIGIAYPFGFDLNKREIVKFPMNKYGLIDEEEMRAKLKEEDKIIGYDPEEYCWSLFIWDVYITLELLLGESFQTLEEKKQIVDDVFQKLRRYNEPAEIIIRDAINLRTEDLKNKKK